MVKIITGPRRAGKSFLMFNIFNGWLLKNKVSEDHIIELKLDKQSNARYRDLDEFIRYFKERKVKDGKTNFFFDQ